MTVKMNPKTQISIQERDIAFAKELDADLISLGIPEAVPGSADNAQSPLTGAEATAGKAGNTLSRGQKIAVAAAGLAGVVGIGAGINAVVDGDENIPKPVNLSVNVDEYQQDVRNNELANLQRQSKVNAQQSK